MHAAPVDVAKPGATADAGAGAGEASMVSRGTGTSTKQVAGGNSGGRGRTAVDGDLSDPSVNCAMNNTADCRPGP
jgi:hypothetical protein